MNKKQQAKENRRQSALKRQRLFKHGRPTIRAYEDPDMGFFWASSDKTESPESFSDQAKGINAQYERVLIIEDRNPVLESGYGPIGVIGIKTDGWKVIPDVSFFTWANPRNRLSGTVAMFRMFQQSKDLGLAEVRIPEDKVRFMSKVRDYGVLNLSAKIPFARPDGAEFIYSVKGKKNGSTHPV